ncbi:MAG TPA: polymorphic toxin-type HINT domain-containing protein [Pirellulales bacterium]|nr:polymorphic toxin-type HINT domain-containing protein [Pirellulales bacterium]
MIATAICFLASAGFGCSVSPCDAGEATKSDITPAKLVRLALEAEAAGDLVGRSRYLARALAADPDYAPAHWQLGEIRRGDQWVEPIQLARDEQQVAKMSEYRRLRDRSKESPQDQRRLAEFAAQANLPEQERLHVENVYRLSPDKSRVSAPLQLVPYGERFVTVAESSALAAKAAQARSATAIWVPRLVAMRNDIMNGSVTACEKALKELKAIRDPGAIPALEAATGLSSAAVGRAVVASLAEIRAQPATVSLVRHAVLAQDPQTRSEALNALKSRSVYAYAPMLLSYMQLPIETRFDTFFLDDGRPAHRLSLFQEGQSQSLSFVSEGALVQRISVRENGLLPRPLGAVDESLNADRQLAQNTAQFNLLQEQVNKRAGAALQSLTEESLPPQPRLWWEWWAQYNEMYSPTNKPVSYMTRTSGTAPVQYQIRYHSCFVPGTEVWTMSGPLPIEDIKVGEFVLSQDVDSGELAYKPVTATTVGPQVRKLVEIAVDGELIRCTYGHLFWVSGVGWKMAKELKPGDLLHTTSGPLPIDSIEMHGKAVCHNLIVADFNTYFVTDQAFLVHDINVRGPTTATVPGLVDEEEYREAPAQP